MLRLAAVAIVFLVIGGAVGRYFLTLPPRIIVQTTPDTSIKPDPGETVFIKWRMASSFPGRLPQYGGLGRSFTAKLRRMSGGSMRIDFEEPGATVPAEQCLEAVAQGRVEACWSTPGLWHARESALAIFSGTPFGPEAREMSAWIYYGGGQELLDEIYGKYGVKSIVCGITAAEAGGWFRKEIETTEDIKGLKIRSSGLGARVLVKLGAEVLRLPGEDIVEAMRKGEIDAAQLWMPAIDVNLKFFETVSNYYFPGWQQRGRPLEILIARKAWEDLPDTNKAMIEAVCGDTVREGMAQGDAIQAAALRELRAKGVQVRTFPEPVIEALRKAWLEVAEEEGEADATFKKVWDALLTFRQEYASWDRLDRLP